MAGVALGCAASAARGEAPATPEALTAAAAAAQPVEVMPGDVLPLGFLVTWHRVEAGVVSDVLRLPAAWAGAIESAPQRLTTGQKALRLKVLRVPRQARAGLYEVRYEARGESETGGVTAHATATAEVRVAARPGLTLELRSPPPIVAAGTEAEAALRITNSGNTDLVVELRDERGGPDGVAISPRRVALAAGAASNVLVTLRTPPHAVRAGQQAVRIVARAAGDGEAPITQAIAVPYEVIPTVDPTADMFHLLSGSARAVYARSHRLAAVQAEVAGESATAEDERKRFSFF